MSTQLLSVTQTESAVTLILGLGAPLNPRLPPEICEHIVDYCAYFSRKYMMPQTLYSCALTCRDWLPRSRANLYHTVELLNERHFLLFTTTVSRNSFLRSFVKELNIGAAASSSLTGQIDLVVEHDKRAPYPVIRPRKRSSSWIAQIPIKLLRFLPSLRQMGFYVLPPSNAIIQMPLTQFRQHRMITSLALYDVKFNFAQDLIRFISWFPALDTLHLRWIHIINDGLKDKRFNFLLPTIRSLIVESVSDLIVLEQVLSLPSIAALQDFRFMADVSEMMPYVEHFVSLCSPTLQFLELTIEETNIMREKQVIPDRIDLSTVSHLKELRLAAALTEKADEIIAGLKLPPNLEEMTIFFKIHRIDVPQVASRAWNALDALLDSSDLKRLKLVRIIFNENWLEDEDRLAIRECMATKFPRLRGKRLLRLDHKEEMLTDGLDDRWE